MALGAADRSLAPAWPFGALAWVRESLGVARGMAVPGGVGVGVGAVDQGKVTFQELSGAGCPPSSHDAQLHLA